MERGSAVNGRTGAGTDFRSLVEQVKDYAIFSTDLEGRATSWNEGVRRVLGFEQHEFIGVDTIHAIFTPEDFDAGIPWRELKHAAAHGSAGNDRWMRRKDGTRFFAFGVTTAIRNEAGALVGFSKVMRDQTAWKLAELDVRRKEERYRTLFTSIDQGFCIVEMIFDEAGHPIDFRFVEVNPAFERHSGINAPLGARMREIVPDNEHYWDEYFGNVARTGEPARFVARAEALGRWFEVDAFPMGERDSGLVGILFRDISRRKEEELKLSYFAAVVADSDDAIITKDLNGNITSWNSGAERLYGYTAEEVIGKSIMMMIPPEHQAEEARILERLRQGGRMEHFETVRCRKDGSRFDVSLTSSPVRDGEGRVIGVSKIARDISERKRNERALEEYRDRLEQMVDERTAELKRAHERQRLADRMAAVGTMASGLAHDITNILMPLSARLDMMLAHMSLDESTHEQLLAVQGLMNHLRELTRNLALFARDPEKEGTVGRTGLEEWAARVRKFMEGSLKPPGTGTGAVQLEFEIEPNLPAVTISPHRLTQAIMNLVHNSRDAILARRAAEGRADNRGRIAVTARLADDGRSVVLAVEDDGIGMDEETRRHCVEPFFTTRDRSGAPGVVGISGSGLGLSLAHQIAERVGGRLDIESQLGKGTRVSMILPVEAAGERGATQFTTRQPH